MHLEVVLTVLIQDLIQLVMYQMVLTELTELIIYIVVQEVVSYNVLELQLRHVN